MRRADRGESASRGGDEVHSHRDHGRDAALETAWRADADQATHDETEIETPYMNQHPLQDVHAWQGSRF